MTRIEQAARIREAFPLGYAHGVCETKTNSEFFSAWSHRPDEDSLKIACSIFITRMLEYDDHNVCFVLHNHQLTFIRRKS